MFHTLTWAPHISPASAEKWKYALLELPKNNQSFKIFLNVKPVLQKAWPLVPNYFQPLYKEGHSFLEDDIFLNQRQFIIITLHFFWPKSCHHEMIFSWTKQKSTWVSKWQSAVKRIKWWKIKGSPLASRFCQSCHLPLEEKRTIKSNSSRNKVQSTLNLISPDMWINIEHVMCVVPKCCHALWEPHKYLDVPKNILMYLKISWCTSEQDFGFCFLF